MQRWRVMVMSEANQEVKQFTFAKVWAYSFLLFITVLSLSLIFTANKMNELSQENAELESSLVAAENSIDVQEEQITDFQKDRQAISNQLIELDSIEAQLQEMIAAMEPESIGSFEDGPQGGLQIDPDSRHPDSLVNEEEDIDLSHLRSEVPHLIERYEGAIDDLIVIKSSLETIPIGWPADTDRITSEYGERTDPFTGETAYHNGIDLADDWGTEIYATADGEVDFSGTNGGYGKSVLIDHDNSFETRYAHLAELEVEAGDEVEQGDVIGTMGTTGRSTGVHLHYEVIQSGETTDPYQFMTFLQRVFGE